MLAALRRKREARERREEWNSYKRALYAKKIETAEGRNLEQERRKRWFRENRDAKIAKSKDFHNRRKNSLAYRARRAAYAAWYKEKRIFGQKPYILSTTIDEKGVIKTTMKIRRYPPGPWNLRQWRSAYFTRLFAENEAESE